MMRCTLRERFACGPEQLLPSVEGSISVAEGMENPFDPVESLPCVRRYWADYMASERRGDPNAKHIQVCQGYAYR